MKTTYILGAGFSRAAGLPLMNDFYLTSKDIFPKLGSPTATAFKHVFDFWEVYSNVKHYLNVDFFNIEELLSIIEMNHYLSESESSTLNEDILFFIREVINQKTPKIDDKSNIYDVYKRFLMYALGIKKDHNRLYRLAGGPENSIISLNYDLLIENTLSFFNINNAKSNIYDRPSFVPFYGHNIEYENDHLNPPDIIEIKIAKLHGSINFKDNLIIPPTWNKTSNEKIKGAWQLAYELLSKTNKIVFIGYSLPQTDSYIKYLLINGIKENKNLKRIEVINPEDEQGITRMRYSTFFDKNLSDKKMFEYLPLKFEEWVETLPKEPKIMNIPDVGVY